MERIVTFVLTLALMLGCFQMAWADTNPTVKVSSVEAEKDETVSVTVSVTGNPGIATFNFVLNFDSDVLTPVSISQGEVLSSGSFVSNIQEPGVDLTALHTVTAVWVNPSNVTADGALYTVTFKITGEETEQASPLTLTYEEGNVCDQEYQDIALNIENGSVKVTAKQSETPVPPTETPTPPTESPVPPTDENQNQPGDGSTVTPTPAADNNPAGSKVTSSPENGSNAAGNIVQQSQKTTVTDSGQNKNVPKTADMGPVEACMAAILTLVSVAMILVSNKKRSFEK